MSVTRKPDPLQAKAIDVITRIRRGSGLSVTEIARQCGLSPSTLTRLYPQPKVNYTLSMRTMAKIATEFPGYVDVGPIPSPKLQAVEEAPSNSVATAIPVYALENDRGDRAREERLSDKFIGNSRPAVELWNDLPASFVTTLPFLTVATEFDRLIAVYLSGDTMEPRLRAGEIAVLDKVKPVPLQADVFVRLNLGDGEIATIIAQIVKRDASNMYFEFLRTPDVQLVISRNEIIEVLPIIAIITNSY